MTHFCIPDRDELEIQIQKQKAELEEIYQDIHTDNMSPNQKITTSNRKERTFGQRVVLNFRKAFSRSRNLDCLELAEVIDIQAIQPLMNNFYKLINIPIGLVDLKGNVLISVEWQDICSKFHRVHSETCMFCIESDTELSKDVSLGKFKLYKCKNNMWDMSTPIVVDG